MVDKWMKSLVKNMRRDKASLLKKEMKSKYSDVRQAATYEIVRRKIANKRKK
jgi:hypothetical protein